MGFYYISIFSIPLLAVVYIVLFLVFWGLARVTRGMPGRKALLAVLGVVFLVLPVAEELWIAWNFGQACKEAGTFIGKKVQVEGFYDDTTAWGPRQLAESKYQFVESKDSLYKKLSRVERANSESRDRALAWYAEKNPSKERSKDLFVVHPVSDSEQIVVSPNSIDAWRVTKLDRPTARYHYKMPHSHSPFAHKIVKHETVVLDSSTGDLLGKYTRFSRGSPWFYISVGKGDFSCDAPKRWPLTKGNFLIFQDVLQPASQR